MSVGITNINSYTTTIVKADIAGLPDMTASYSTRRYRPDCIVIEFVFGPGQHRGWWVARSVRVSGRRILKTNAPDGSVRLSSLRAATCWYSLGTGTGDVQTDQDLPEEVDAVVSELRPSGQVTTASRGA